MTASPAGAPSVDYSVSSALINAVVTRDFAPGKSSVRPASPADDAPRFFNCDVHQESLSEALGTPIRLLSPIDAYSRQLEKRLNNFPATVSAYDDRISVLEEQASTEGYFLNSGSKVTLQDFFRNNPIMRLGRLALLENGNLRAVWKGDNSSHIGLQFLDNGFIQYVLFKQRHADLPVSRACGRDTPLGILEQISAFELGEILYP